MLSGIFHTFRIWSLWSPIIEQVVVWLTKLWNTMISTIEHCWNMLNYYWSLSEGNGERERETIEFCSESTSDDFWGQTDCRKIKHDPVNYSRPLSEKVAALSSSEFSCASSNRPIGLIWQAVPTEWLLHFLNPPKFQEAKESWSKILWFSISWHMLGWRYGSQPVAATCICTSAIPCSSLPMHPLALRGMAGMERWRQSQGKGWGCGALLRASGTVPRSSAALTMP